MQLHKCFELKLEQRKFAGRFDSLNFFVEYSIEPLLLISTIRPEISYTTMITYPFWLYRLYSLIRLLIRFFFTFGLESGINLFRKNFIKTIWKKIIMRVYILKFELTFHIFLLTIFRSTFLLIFFWGSSTLFMQFRKRFEIKVERAKLQSRCKDFFCCCWICDEIF